MSRAPFFSNASFTKMKRKIAIKEPKSLLKRQRDSVKTDPNPGNEDASVVTEPDSDTSREPDGQYSEFKVSLFLLNLSIYPFF